jgi:hypothetical protein
MTKMKKNIKHGWHAISFSKDALWFLNFTNHASCAISVPKYLYDSILVPKFFFVFFYSWLREEGERSH